jgi:hypothetical protein
VWIPDSKKTANGVAEVPLTEIAVKPLRDQLTLAETSPWLFPSDENPGGHQKALTTMWHAAFAESFGAILPNLRPPFHVRDAPERRRCGARVGDSTARQGHTKVLKKYAQMKCR